MTNIVGKAVDFANFTRIPAASEIGCWEDLGFSLAIVGASFHESVWGPNQPKKQLTALQAMGFRRHAYSWLRHPFAENRRLFDQAFVQIAGTGVEMMWIDVEDTESAGRVTKEQRVIDVWQAIDYWHNARPDLPLGIYTGKWYWDIWMSGVKETFGLPLWLAAYVLDEGELVARPQLDDDFMRKYIPGGWKPEDVWLWQYIGSILTCNLNVDRNIILEAGRMKYTDEVLDKTFGAILNDLGQKGAQIVALGQGLAQVAQDLYTHIYNNGDFTRPQMERLEAIQKVILETNAHVDKLVADIVAAGVAFRDQ